MEADPIFAADNVRSALMWNPWYRGVLVDERNPPSLKVIVAREGDTQAAREALHPFSKMYNLRTKISVLTDALEGHGTLRPAHLLPYTCHGFDMHIPSKSHRADGRLAYIPTTEAELRSLTTTIGEVFSESLNHQIIVGVATGGIPLLHYLIARWCRHTYGCEWPVTKAQYEASQGRFKLLFGFRSGDEGSRNLGAAALTGILQGAGKVAVMVDSTFRRTGIHTIASAARDSIKVAAPSRMTVVGVIDRSRNDGDPTPDDSTEDLKCPLHLRWFEADRILTEDIGSAIGYIKEPGKRVIKPLTSDGILVAQRDSHTGHTFMLGTLANCSRAA